MLTHYSGENMIKRVLVLAAFACLPFQSLAAKIETLPMPIAPELPVEIVLHQQEIGVTVPPNAGVAFGLIGALVGSAINNAQVANGEKRVAEIRNLLVDYRFNEQMEKALRAKLVNAGISPQPVITVRESPWEAVAATQAATTAADVFVITPSYTLSNNFEAMSVSLNAQMVHREIKANGKPKVRARFGRNYVFNIPMQKVDGSNADEDAKRWIALGKPGLQTLVDRGIAQVTDMLVYDFSSEGRAESAKKVSGGEKASLNGRSFAGRQLRADSESVWTRIGNNWMQSITAYNPISGQPIAAVPSEPAAAAAPTAAAGQGSP